MLQSGQVRETGNYPLNIGLKEVIEEQKADQDYLLGVEIMWQQFEN